MEQGLLYLLKVPTAVFTESCPLLYLLKVSHVKVCSYSIGEGTGCVTMPTYHVSWTTLIANSSKDQEEEVGTRHHVNERSACNGTKQKEQLKTLPRRNQGLSGEGRKPKHWEVEEQLAAWIEHHWANDFSLTRTTIQQKAMQLNQGDEKFSASITNPVQGEEQAVIQQLPQDLNANVATFVLRLRSMWLHH